MLDVMRLFLYIRVSIKTVLTFLPGCGTLVGVKRKRAVVRVDAQKYTEKLSMVDVLIKGGTVVDGTGGTRFRADVAVDGGRIVSVRENGTVPAREILDAEGLVVSPGLIDAQSHSDVSFLVDSSGASKLYQGITTEITGNCGDSPIPNRRDEDISRTVSLQRFLERFGLEGHCMAVNQALLVGHGTLRECVMGPGDRAPTPEELMEMQRLLARELESGAWGLSLGLEYAPGCFASQGELNALGAVAARYDGVVSCHMRSEGLEIDRAIEELAEVGRYSGGKVNISHLKIDNFRVHGRAGEVWDRIERIRREGVRLSADMYPYTASCTELSIRCPRWSLDGGSEALLARLSGPRRREIVEGIRAHYFNAQRAETCLFCDDGGLWPEIVGRTLREVAESLCLSEDYAEVAARVLERTRARARCIFFVMSEQDMLTFLKQDVGIGSDGYALPLEKDRLRDKPHPRSYGAIAEFLRLAREKKICTLEEAVRRVTGKPAALFGLKDRGLLQEGCDADICVFDAKTVAPRATYLDPCQSAQGVRHVLVNGSVALRDGWQTEVRAGQFLRKRRG